MSDRSQFESQEDGREDGLEGLLTDNDFEHAEVESTDAKRAVGSPGTELEFAL